MFAYPVSMKVLGGFMACIVVARGRKRAKELVEQDYGQYKYDKSFTIKILKGYRVSDRMKEHLIPIGGYIE